MRKLIARQVNRAQRGKNWVQSLYFPMTAFIALRQMPFFDQFSTVAIVASLFPASIIGMWAVGYFDETRGIWSQQMEHKSGFINPIMRDAYQHIVDVKEELGMEISDEEKSVYLRGVPPQ